MADFFSELLDIRGFPSSGTNSVRFVEANGGMMVPMSFWELDAGTSRDEYYYNSRLNVLFRRVGAVHPVSGVMKYYWKRVSDF